MPITVNQIKQLREKTQAGIMEAKKALEESGGDIVKAEAWIAKHSLAKAEKKVDRETGQGTIGAYIHHDSKRGALVKLLCETDFVARTDEFKNLAKELAMQVTSMNPESKEAFLEQEYIRDPKLTITELIKQTVAKTGENIQLDGFVRLEL
jgi:elongation factor Ts